MTERAQRSREEIEARYQLVASRFREYFSDPANLAIRDVGVKHVELGQGEVVVLSLDIPNAFLIQIPETVRPLMDFVQLNLKEDRVKARIGVLHPKVQTQNGVSVSLQKDGRGVLLLTAGGLDTSRPLGAALLDAMSDSIEWLDFYLKHKQIKPE